MFFIYAIITLLMWGIADLFYKKGNDNDDKLSFYKTGISVGFVMGIYVILYALIKGITFSFMDILRYLPISLCYIISMLIGYHGLKYINLSISSPIQNTSGIITSLLLILIFKEIPNTYSIIGLIIMTIGLLLLTVIEKNNHKEKIFNAFKISIIFFPILYLIIDGLGTFLDSVYLDKLEIISEDVALISYGLTFLVYGLIMLIILKFKKIKFKFKEDKNKWIAAIFETIGQVTYVYAIASHSEITAPIVGSYSALSIILSKVFLKEKLTKKEIISLILIFLGIILLGIFEEN